MILQKTEEINKLMVQLQSVERKYQMQISQIHQESAQKERTLAQQVQSLQTSQSSVANVERRYQAQIEQSEQQIKDMQAQYQAQASTYQS